MVVHNETSTGVTSRIPDIRAAMGDHDALLLVDTISSLGSIDYRHEEWGVDVTVGGSQKGLMLPAGLSFNAVSEKALAASRDARMPRSYWDWTPIIAANEAGFWPYTSATNLLYGLRRSGPDAARGGARERLRPPRAPRRRPPAPRCTAGAWRCWRSTSASSRAR